MAHYTAAQVLAAGHTVHPSGDRHAVVVLDTGDSAEQVNPNLAGWGIHGPAVVQFTRCRDGRVTQSVRSTQVDLTGTLLLGPAAGMLIDGPSPYSQLVAETLAVWYRLGDGNNQPHRR